LDLGLCVWNPHADGLAGGLVFSRRLTRAKLPKFFAA
jgi:hypothetical protein